MLELVTVTDRKAAELIRSVFQVAFDLKVGATGDIFMDDPDGIGVFLSDESSVHSSEFLRGSAEGILAGWNRATDTLHGELMELGREMTGHDFTGRSNGDG